MSFVPLPVTGRARWAVLTIGVTAGLILFVCASIPLLLRTHSIQAKIRSRIQSEVQARLGHEVQIGEVRVSAILRSLNLRDVRIASRERPQDGVLAKIDEVQLYPNLMDLLRFRLRLRRIVLRHPIVRLELPRRQTEPGSPRSVLPPVGIEHVEIRDGSVLWRESGIELMLIGLYADLRETAGVVGGTLQVKESKIQGGTAPVILRDLALRAEIDGGDIQVKQFHLSALGAAIQGAGRIRNFLTDATLDLTLQARGGLDGLFPEKLPIPLRGAVLLEGKATGPLADPSFTGSAAVGNGQVEQVAASGMTVAVLANRRELRLHELTLRTVGGDLSGEITLTWEKLRYRLALRGEQIDLADAMRLFTEKTPVGGQATIRIQATGEGADPRGLRGQAHVRIAELHLVDRPEERGHGQFVLDARDGRVHVRQGAVEIGGARLHAKGVVQSSGEVDLGVDAHFPQIEHTGRLVGIDPHALAGRVTLKGQIRGTPKALHGQGAVTLTNGLVLEEHWNRGRATVHLEQKGLRLEGLELRREDETIEGRFEVDFNGATQFDLNSNWLALDRLALIRNSGLTGTVRVLSAKGKGPIGRPDVTTTLEVGDLAYRGTSLGRGRGTLTWEGARSRMTGLLSLPDRGYTLHSVVTTTGAGPYEGTLTLEKGDLGSLLRIVGASVPHQVNGVGSGRIEIGGRLGEQRPERATADLEAVQLDVRGHTFWTQGRTHLAFQGGRLMIPSLLLRGEGTEVTVGGSIGEEMDVTIRGAASGTLISALLPDGLDATGVMDLNVKIQGTPQLPRYRGHLRAKDASLTVPGHPEPLEHLVGEIRFEETTVETTQLQARWGGGTLGATVQGRREQPGWRWRMQFTLEEGRAERMVKNQGSFFATGQVRASGVVTAGGGEDFLRSLGGRVRIEMMNGRIQRSFVLERILRMTNLTGLFKKGPEGKGMPYDGISATFDLEDGIARTENLKLRSTALRAVGVGRMDLAHRTVDAVFAVQPMNLTDKVLKTISELPLIKELAIGTFLFGKEKSILVLSFRIHGPLTQPAVEGIPTQSVERGVLGIFKRILDLPGDLRSGDGQDPDRGPDVGRP